MRPESNDKQLRVLVVDDSAVMRGMLRTLFAMHAEKPWGDLPRMELCGMAQDGVECLAAVLRLRPDVVVLDLEMPRMHGLDVLERLRMDEPNLPVIMCSSYTERGARTTLDALALGAADYVMKPSEQANIAMAMETLSAQLLPKIAALAGVGSLGRDASGGSKRAWQRSSMPARQGFAPAVPPIAEVVVIGVSTGGPSALEQVLPALPADFPVPILIVQHMPKLFTGALAERLDRMCALHVEEAKDGVELRAGTILLAPGDAHMEIALTQDAAQDGSPGRRGTRVVRLHQQRSLNHCKPSVDYLFNSAAPIYGMGTLAVVMTGMGADGLIGARRVHEAGGVVLVQDEASSAVWGMPGRVFQAGISSEPVGLANIASELTGRVRTGRGKPPQTPVAASSKDSQRRSVALNLSRREGMHGLL